MKKTSIYKFITVILTTLMLNGLALSQTDDFSKNEFYLGYSAQAVDTIDGRPFANGFEASYTRNFTRYLGFRTSFSGDFRNQDRSVTITDPTNGTYSLRVDEDRSVYNVLGGLQIKDNSENGRLKPFAYLLAGIAHSRNTSTLTCASGNCPAVGNTRLSDTGFGAALGGGIDVRINRRIDLRLIQADFNPIYSSNRSENNFRIGAGIVFE